jgi:hypothetical protein
VPALVPEVGHRRHLGVDGRPDRGHVTTLGSCA